MKVLRNKIYQGLFIALCIVYGAFSTSSPDVISWAEVFIGIALVLVIGAYGAIRLFRRIHPKKSFDIPPSVLISMAYLIFVPSITGFFVSQNETGDYIRDLIPLLYFFLPVFLWHRFIKAPTTWLTLIVNSLCVIGLLFSLRFWEENKSSVSLIGKALILSENKDSIMQDPAPLFALAYLAAIGLYFVLSGRVIRGILLMGASTLIWTMELASIMRAPVALGLLVLAITFAWYVWRGRKKQVVVTFIILVVGVFVWSMIKSNTVDFLQEILNLFYYKNSQVGINQRDLEFLAVYDFMDTPYKILFGGGWGIRLSNPIGNGAYWRFVHNFFLYFIYKTGIFGTLALFVYLRWIFRAVMHVLPKLRKEAKFIILISLIPPLVETMVLQASYKTLTFGIVLCIPVLLYLQSLPDRAWSLSRSTQPAVTGSRQVQVYKSTARDIRSH